MKAKRIYIYSLIAAAVLVLGACSRSHFATLNSNPLTVLTIQPETELTTGQLSRFNNSYEAFYDFYEYIRHWTQSFVPVTGLSGGSTQFVTVSNGDVRWSTMYTGVGPNLMDVQEIISKMPIATQVKYVYMNAIAGINLAEYAFYTSDPNGSMPYTQALQARYTGNLTPTWNTQQALFDTLDTQLQAYVKILETPQGNVVQDTGGINELVYGGSVNKWIKAANSLRLRMAMRLLKQNPSQLTTIANEVLADPIGMISSNDEDWTFQSGDGLFGGNYSPFYGGYESLERNVVKYMVANGDPRISDILQPSVITTQDEFDSAQIQGAIPAGLTFDGQTYRGQYASPDSVKANPVYSATITYSYGGVPTTGYYASVISPNILYAQYPSANGTTPNGSNAVPVITYADVCFMRAELVLRGLDNDPLSAQTLYYNGITSSLEDFDKWANLALEPGYTALSQSQITAYEAAPGVIYQPTHALEQVLVQQYLHDYMNPSEGWALIKRTGYPSPTGVIMPLENMTFNSEPIVMPRRFPTQYPEVGDLNYNNDMSAITAEQAQPGYGTQNQITGMVWWDQ